MYKIEGLSNTKDIIYCCHSNPIMKLVSGPYSIQTWHKKKYTVTVTSLTSWCDIQTGNFMFKCSLAKVKNNYKNKSSHV